ncbi:acetylajmalan esterase-like [Panicum miliaceum]|uniref:Acetylajmalan esterase-like n=1 Tax=Panicum miliaceum TaxID=4540 RepID=A0A3L6T679_PANMI|nr:acetylajmalan esterase-like [Panicum miliaceum]
MSPQIVHPLVNHSCYHSISSTPGGGAAGGAPGASVAYADYYNSFLTLLHNASLLGFDAASTCKACCGAGGGEYNFDWRRMCGFEGETACADPSAQMTQAAYRAMAMLIYHGKYLQPQILSFPKKYGQTQT